jgi:uncharacterized repeat protein (TIGR03803 family)
MHTTSAPSRTFALVAIMFILAIPSRAQPSEKILYSFTNSGDGGYPQGGLIIDSKGNLYGTTSGGGTSQSGTVFQLSPGSNGTWAETVIYSFGFGPTDGSGPYGGLVIDSNGNLYGATRFGGASFRGTVYELSPGANGIWNERVLYSFTGGADGGSPYDTNLTIDNAGNLYGTTVNGGTYQFGVVFELVAGANGTFTEKVLHAFTGGDDGANPYNSSVVIDSAGKLYGIAREGEHDYGLVFELAPQPDGTWSEKVIYAFSGAGGEANPLGGLLLDSVGRLYGVAYDAFELVPESNGITHKTLHTFSGAPDGAYPESALIADKTGNLYGTSNDGGDHYGTVFELMAGPNGNWTERVLHRFSSSGGDGMFPTFAPLVIDASGNLYGVTPTGGASNFGVVFEVTP